ncbi:MAG: hypothetical protein A4E35_02011 [Methanoregula sp. PtaU1.Bin051]|nr:MAG: hypothetical protein A4E35_02011 [Methanoregula sp. PtaU1.Bin051]
MLPNGTAYNASVDIADADRFEFHELGILGERIPIKAGNIQLSGNCSPCNYTANGFSVITFEKGNYTLLYMAPLRDFHLQAAFDKPYSVNVTLPEGFDARNPLLAGISPAGAAVTGGPENSTTIAWNRTAAVDLRFYDRNRETLLYFFGNFWIVIAIVLLTPFFLTMRKKG